MKTRIKHIDWLLLRAYDKLHTVCNNIPGNERGRQLTEAMGAVEFLLHQRWDAISRSKSRRRK